MTTRFARPVTDRDVRSNRNLSILALIGSIYLGYQADTTLAVAKSQKSIFMGASFVSLAGCLFVLAILFAWNSRFIARHLRDGNSFFAAFDRRVRDRYLPVCKALFLPMTGVVIGLLLGGHPVFAGALAGPTFWLDLIVVGFLTGGIRPLEDARPNKHAPTESPDTYPPQSEDERWADFGPDA